MMDDRLAQLERIGFEKVGDWNLATGAIDFDVWSCANSANLLYAFDVDDVLTYIGKTRRTLADRLRNYRSPGEAASTNFHNNRRINEALCLGKAVSIHTLVDPGELQHFGFAVSLAAGLEDSLIRELDPEWNGGLKESSDEVLVPVAPSFTVHRDETRGTVFIPKKADFLGALCEMFERGHAERMNHIEVNVKELYESLGGDPGFKHHNIRGACDAMRYAATGDDEVLDENQSGYGRRLTIRYILPRNR